jgi:hypothetical protein
MNTTDGAVPLLSIALRDGSALTIARDAVRLGGAQASEAPSGETIALDRVQDARQIVPEPPTFALRVAGRRLLEFQPANPAEGALALEAIYRLRPDLRPAGFESPASVPEWWPSASATGSGRSAARSEWSPAASAAAVNDQQSRSSYRHDGTGYGTGSVPPYASGQDAGSASRLAPSQLGPARPAGTLAAYPRDLLGLIGASFRLFRAHWREWLLLGLIVSAPPAILSGALQMLFYAVRGFNPWRGLDTAAIGIWPARPPRAAQLAELVALVVALLVAELVAFAWQAAAFGPAGDEALLGAPVDPRASVVHGARRFVSVLLVTLAAFAGPLVAMCVPLALTVALSPVVEGSTPSATPSAVILAADLLGCLSSILFLVLFVAGLYAMTRLFVAPYLAATEPLDVRSALVASWRLTGGRGRWWQAPGWRALAAVGIVWVVTIIVTAPLANVEPASFGLASLVVDPLGACVTGPLVSLVFVVALRDLRLRARGAIATHHKP